MDGRTDTVSFVPVVWILYWSICGSEGVGTARYGHMFYIRVHGPQRALAQVWLKFTGRMMGKALFDGHPLKAHLAPTLYKHMLQVPIKLEDLKGIENERCSAAGSQAFSLLLALAFYCWGRLPLGFLAPNVSLLQVQFDGLDEG